MDRDVFLARPDEYDGGATLLLGSEAFRDGGTNVWARFLASTAIPATRIDSRASTPQTILDSLSNHRQLEYLFVKHGNYSDLSPLAGLPNLTSLSLGHATKVSTIAALASLPALEFLRVSGAFSVLDLTPLAALVNLKELHYGNDYPGSDKMLEVKSFDWVRTLMRLEVLDFPGTRILEPDFSALLALPRLRELSFPLRRSYRAQVFSLAKQNSAFAGLAQSYLGYEAMRLRLREQGDA